MVLDIRENLVRQYQKEAIIVDMLTYLPTLTDPSYLDVVLNARITCLHVTACDSYANFRSAIKSIVTWHQTIKQFSNKLILATSVKDIKRAKKENKVSVILGMQNAKPIEDDLGLLYAFYKLGIRVIQPAYQNQNFLGSGCNERRDVGLSNFGIKAVEEMNKLGIVIDLSHCNYRTTMDTIECSKDPVVCTHTCPRALVDHPRNKTDEEIKALAEKNGVLGISAYSPICSVKKGQWPTLEDFFVLLDYVVDLVGDNYVGFGFDFTPLWTKKDFNEYKAMFPELFGTYELENLHVKGLSNHSDVPKVIEKLIDRGYSKRSIMKILGGNFIRVFRTVCGE